MIIIDFIFCLFILILGFNLKNSYPEFTLSEKKMLNKIFYFHILICFIATPIFYKGGDALAYWMIPKDMSLDEVWINVLSEGRATSKLYLINYFFSNTLCPKLTNSQVSQVSIFYRWLQLHFLSQY